MRVDVRTYGAVGDGITLDTEALQKAIDDSSARGVEVFFSKGNYLTGTLMLKSNSTLYLDKGAMILGSSDFSDYTSDIRPFLDAVSQERGRCLIFGEDVTNVKIKGSGTVHGRGEAFGDNHPEHKRRPFLFRFLGCKGLKIEDIQVRNSPAWCMHFQDCEEVQVKGISIISRVNHNNDGMDIDSCRNFTIEDCSIDTGDDGICLKATIDKPCAHICVKDCIISSRWAALKIGTESYGDFNDIRIENCRIYDTEGCGIKLVPVDGANVENVLIKDIFLSNCTGPIFVALGERLRTYYAESAPKAPGGMKNITFSGIKAEVRDAEGFAWNPGMLKGFVTHNGIWGNGKGAIVFSGTPCHRIENILLEDFDVLLPGGGTEEDAAITEIIEMGQNYPEFHVFGTLPSYGFFIRHVDGIQMKNIKLRLKNQDCRQPIYVLDVEGLETCNFETL